LTFGALAPVEQSNLGPYLGGGAHSIGAALFLHLARLAPALAWRWWRHEVGGSKLGVLAMVRARWQSLPETKLSLRPVVDWRYVVRPSRRQL